MKCSRRVEILRNPWQEVEVMHARKRNRPSKNEKFDFSFNRHLSTEWMFFHMAASSDHIAD